jgi:hypothetical protein
MEDTTGINLLNGCVIFPHFKGVNSQHHGACQTWADSHGVTIIALPEECGIVVGRDGVVSNAGPQPACVFTPNNPITIYETGQSWKL